MIPSIIQAHQKSLWTESISKPSSFYFLFPSQGASFLSNHFTMSTRRDFRCQNTQILCPPVSPSNMTATFLRLRYCYWIRCVNKHRSLDLRYLPPQIQVLKSNYHTSISSLSFHYSSITTLRLRGHIEGYRIS